MNKLNQYLAKLSKVSISWSLVDQAVVSGGNFMLSILLARGLGVETFGVYTLWYMLPLFLLSLHQAFISQPFQALCAAKAPGQQQQYANNLWAIQLVFGVLIIGLGGIISLVTQLLLPFAASLLAVLVALHDYLRKYGYTLGYTNIPLVMDSLLYLAVLPIALLFSFFEPLSLAIIFLLFSACYLLVIIGFSYWLKCYRTTGALSVLSSICKEHYHFSFWLLGAALVQWVAGNGFILAAAAVLGPAALGGLRMAQQLIGICHVLFLALENTAPVAAAHHFYQKGIGGLKTYIHKLTIRSGLAVGILLGVLAVIGPYLATVLFGESYAAYTGLIVAYAVLYMLVFLAIPLRIALRTIQETQAIFWAYTLGAGCSLVLAYPMVTAWGLTGVMAGLFLTQGSGLAIYYYAWQRASIRSAATLCN